MLVMFACLGWPAAAQGQADPSPGASPDPSSDAPSDASSDEGTDAAPRVRLFTDFDFHLAIAQVGSDDEQFVWDADYGGDIDLLDYGTGRVNFLANYEAILGEQLRRFDPNQGNYTLDISGSWRVGRLEVAGVFHHISRHLADRRKTFPIDWNMVGVQVRRPFAAGQAAGEVHGRALWTIKRSFVDYRAEYGGGASVRRPVHPRLALVGSGGVTIVPVDASVFGRGTQTGASLEGGVRIDGTGAAMEFFVAVERRIDASPFDRQPRTWGMVGLRLVGR